MIVIIPKDSRWQCDVRALDRCALKARRVSRSWITKEKLMKFKLEKKFNESEITKTGIHLSYTFNDFFVGIINQSVFERTSAGGKSMLCHF